MNRAERRQMAKELAQQMQQGAVVLGNEPQRPTTIFLAWMYNENGARPTGAWVQSLLSCAARSASLGFQMRPRVCETGPQLDKARNLLLRSFLETEDEYLLFSDTDIAFAPEDVAALLEADAPIAGGLYFTAAAGAEPWPVALEWEREAEPVEGEGSGGPELPEPSLVPISFPEPPDDLPIEEMGAFVEESLRPRRVDAVGAGLLLIKRTVAQAVFDAHDGWAFAFLPDQGEDVTFCLRAAELGYETVVVPKARVGHIKAVVL